MNDEPIRDATFDQLIDRFLASRSARPRKVQWNDRSFAKQLRETFQLPMITPAAAIRPGDILAWLNTEAARRQWKNRTFNHYRLWLLEIFDLAAADRLIRAKDHPFAEKLIKRKRPNAVVRNIPSQEQFAQIIDNVREVDSEEAADFLEFLGLAGVGQAEASALCWRDVTGNKLRFVRRKTGIAFEVPIYVWLAPLMAKRDRVRLRGEPSVARVFQIQEAGAELRAACDRLGLTRFTQRGLRAMLIKRLYDNGVPAKRIALWQGHRDGGKLIQEIYTEVFCDTDAAAEAADLAKVGGSVDLTSQPRLTVVA